MSGVASARAERVAAAGGECPVWRAAQGALHWVDIPNSQVRYDAARV
ncbi:hypothetical protein [Paraburkholderia pallida]|nr:hypothetical protein [Paraburkholderia pallida]